jgi:hypothetical protein
MGAWGHRNFENDAALDFLAEFRQSPSEVALVEALTIVVEMGEDEEYIDADEAGAALVAAELVAAARQRPAPDFPADVAPLLVALDTAEDEDLLELAQEAVAQVLRKSELQELWAENGEPNEWQAVQQDLLVRLTE